MMRRRDNTMRHVAVAATFALVAVGCSGADGDEDADADASTEPTATSGDPVETTITSTTATTSTSTTEPPAATTSEQPADETTTTTSTATSSEAPDGSDPEAELVAALAAFTSGWTTCVAQLPACDLNGLTASRAGDELESAVQILSGANTNGWTASNVESYRTQFESAEFIGDDAAVVTACNEDGVVIRQGGEIVNDRVSSRRTQWTFELMEGTWKATTGVELESQPGTGNLCDF